MGLFVHELLLGMREALVIWLVLLIMAIAAFASLAAPGRRERRMERRREAEARVDWAQLRRVRVAAQAEERRTRVLTQAEELGRYAEEVAVAAGRAAVTARGRHAEWVAAQRTQEAAWRAYDAADTAARRVLKAAAFAIPEMPLTDEERTARERYMRRITADAYRRGELPVEQLSDVLAHRNGWDPHRHPCEQEAMLRRAVMRQMLRAYQAASTLERTAWHATEMAATAKRSLDDEAFAAAQQAQLAQTRLAVVAPPRRSRAGLARRPSLATR